MENGSDNRKFESVFSRKVRAGKRRTYFFDVRQTKGDDYYVTLTESTRKFDDGGYERHKIFLYKEDFNRFLASLTETIDHVKTELIPDYDYDEFTRRQLEWEEKRRLEDEAAANGETLSEEGGEAETTTAAPAVEAAPETPAEPTTEDDMSW